MSREYTVPVTRESSSQTDRGKRARVTMVATPGDGSCGIGTYARNLLDGIDDVDADTVFIPQDDRSLRYFVALAVQAVRGGGDVIHVQHEYGLFRRDGSKYPGVMGLVFFPLLYLLSSVRSKRTVVTMHSVLKLQPDEASLSVRLYLILMHKLLALCTAHLVFLSSDCASKFLSDIDLDPEEYSVLSHGVKTDVPTDVSTAEAKRQFGFDPDDDLVAIPGFIRPPKGHDIFIEVARRLPEYEFVIAGGARPKGADFEFAERIRREAPENVTVTGVLDDEDYWRALAAPDLALLPYRVVTQSGTFNCCASQELPVLASDADYFTRIENRWGVPETVDIDDTAAIVDRIRTLLEDDTRRRRLASIMHQYKRANSFEQVGSDHMRIYHHVREGTVSQMREVGTQSESSPPTPRLAACSAQRSLPTD
jgi:glycosyltransferase involved in cell wall biosynthesis